MAVKVITLHEPSGQNILLNPKGVFVIKRQEMERSGQTVIVPRGGGDPIIVKETPDELEALGVFTR